MNKDEMIKEAKCHKCIHFPVCSLWTKTDLIADETHKYYCRHYANEKELSQVGDDEIVIKKQAYEKLVEEFAKQEEIAHSYEQGYTELLETNHLLQDELEKTKQEKREILQTINKYLVGTRGIYTIKTFRNCRFEDLMLVRADDLEMLVKKLAKEHGVELED